VAILKNNWHIVIESLTVVVLLQYFYNTWMGKPIILSNSELQKIFKESDVLIHAEVLAVSHKNNT
jgi:hypothetical protein